MNLNEGTGTTAYDTSGVASPANGVLSGHASWILTCPTAVLRACLRPPRPCKLNGNSPGVTMGAISAFGNSTTSTFSSARTISGWVYLAPNTNNPGDWHDLFGFIAQEDTSGIFFDWESFGGNYGVHTYGGDTSSGHAITEGQWVYLTGTAAPGDPNVNIYVNGQLAASGYSNRAAY